MTVTLKMSLGRGVVDSVLTHKIYILTKLHVMTGYCVVVGYCVADGYYVV